MKLSFSLPSKPSSKPNLNGWQNLSEEQAQDSESPTHEYVTEFHPSKALTNNKPNKLIIPPMANECQLHKKMKNLNLPVQSNGSDLRFELESSSLAEDSNISCGLNLRQSKSSESDNGGGDVERPRSAPVETVLLQKLRDDLKRLREDPGFEEFEEVPVEGFGAALLAGYGWYEGRGIGKNAKGDVRVVQYERRTDKEGLGFVRDTHKERVKETKGPFLVGKDVRVVGGTDAGLKGRIVEVLGEDWAVLKLSKSEEEVKVRVGDVAELGSKEEEKCLKKLKKLEIGGTGEVSWLTSRIRVTILSKEFEGGRLHLKKGEVVDVVGPTSCHICMDDSGELIQGVQQDILETALPLRGGPVLVLYGKHKGVNGILVEKDLVKETGAVLDSDSGALLNVPLGQIAEFIGDPSFIVDTVAASVGVF